MTDQTPSDKAASKPPESDQTPNRAKKPRQSRGQSGGGLKRFLLWSWLALMLAVLLAAGYGLWWGWNEFTDQRARLGSMEQQLAEQDSTLDQQQQRLDTLPGRLERRLTEKFESASRDREQTLAALEQQVSGLQQRLNAIAGTDRDDWKLAEAQYLLRLANQRLILERDARNALALAETADEILHDLGGSDLLPIRRALANDIEALKLADQVDREGLYLRLEAMAEQLQTLPLVNPLTEAQAKPDDSTAPEQEGEAAAESGAWARVKGSFNRLLGRLDQHIRIRRHDRPVSALADPREQFVLRQRLQLKLDQARTALLRGQPELYRDSLVEAADWIGAHYRMNPQSESVQQRLREMAELDIRPELPQLDEALNRLEAHMRQRRQLSPEFQRAPSGESDS